MSNEEGPQKPYTHRERNMLQTNQYLRDTIRKLLDRPKDRDVRAWARKMLEAADIDAEAAAKEANQHLISKYSESRSNACQIAS